MGGAESTPVPPRLLVQEVEGFCEGFWCSSED